MGRRRAEVVALASLVILNLLCSPILVSAAVSACPWGRDPKLTELRAACLCATNIAQQLSVQVSILDTIVHHIVIIWRKILCCCNFEIKNNVAIDIPR